MGIYICPANGITCMQCCGCCINCSKLETESQKSFAPDCACGFWRKALEKYCKDCCTKLNEKSECPKCKEKDGGSNVSKNKV